MICPEPTFEDDAQPQPGPVAETLPEGCAAVRLPDGRLIRIGWPEFGRPMYYPTRALGIEAGKLRVAHDLGADGEAIEAGTEITSAHGQPIRRMARPL